MKRTGNKRGLLLAVLLPLLGAAQPGGGVTPDTTKPTKHEFTQFYFPFHLSGAD